MQITILFDLNECLPPNPDYIYSIDYENSKSPYQKIAKFDLCLTELCGQGLNFGNGNYQN